jgi:D-alanine-D-alanine ligase
VNFKKLKIWVLYGGPSKERDVSLRSGRGIVEALKSRGHEVEGFDVLPGEKIISLNWKQKPDIVYIALHGTFGEDGTIQGFLEAVQVPYVGCGVQSSAICFHKSLAKKQMATHGIPMPFSYDFTGEKGFFVLENSGSLCRDFYERNWFIKPAREGSTIGIERFRGAEQDSRKSREAFHKLLKNSLSFDQDILVEEWVEGAELTVPLLLGKALPVVEIRPDSKFYDYESKYTKGKTNYLCPAPLSAEQTHVCQEVAERCFVALDCRDYGRVDMIMGREGPKVLEMNTLPGMTETSLVPKSAAAAGLDYATFLEKLIFASLERQQK